MVYTYLNVMDVDQVFTQFSVPIAAESTLS